MKPSYPSAVCSFGSVHEVVNHNLGFVNENGAHTNQIENLWSHLKQEYRARGGINHNRILLFLKEFSWKKKNLINNIKTTLWLGFVKILKLCKMTV